MSHPLALVGATASQTETQSFQLAQEPDGTMIMETENELQQVSVDSEGNPVYPGTIYVIVFLGLLMLIAVSFWLKYLENKRKQLNS